jgi:uncharacterized OB-fold protein
LTDYAKPLPRPTPETEDFWAGARAGELRLQRCRECAHVYFPPRPFCPRCSSRSVEAFVASGRGRLHTYVISNRPAPGFENEGPYAIAVVELEEGPRMMSNIVGVESTPEALQLDMPLEVTFEPATDTITLPKFRPAAGS